MVDLSNLSNAVEIGGGVIGVLTTVYGAYYKWVIAPANREKVAQAKAIKDLQDSLELLKSDLKDSKKQLADDISDIKDDIKNLDTSKQKEIDESKQDFKDLNSDINDRMIRQDAKSERLLDLIIKYFTDKND